MLKNKFALITAALARDTADRPALKLPDGYAEMSPKLQVLRWFVRQPIVLADCFSQVDHLAGRLEGARDDVSVTILISSHPPLMLSNQMFSARNNRDQLERQLWDMGNDYQDQFPSE